MAGVSAEYGWRFLRAAGLLSVAFIGLEIIIGSVNYYHMVQQKMFLVTLMAWLSVLGMVFARFVHLSQKVGRVAGVATCAIIFIYIVLNYAHLGIRAALGSVGINWLHVYLVCIYFLCFCFGMYAQTWLGEGLCRKNVARVALVAFLVGMMVLGYCSYMMLDRMRLERALTPFVCSTLCLLRELSMLAVGLSMSVLAISRTAYRLTRLLSVKIVLFALAFVSLFFLLEVSDDFVALVFVIPYFVAILMLASSLARWMVKALRWF